MIVIVRDPLEVRISRYSYIWRMHERYGLIANDDWHNALNHELIDYISLSFPDLSQWLDLPREQFSFVGRMDRFEEDMKRLSDWLSVPYLPVKTNANPEAKPEIPDEWRRRYEAANPSEVALYRQFTE